MNSDPANGSETSTTNRVVEVLFGIFLVAMAVAILVWADRSAVVGPILAAMGVGGLGIEAIYSAVRGKRSLVARIGPLP